MQFARGTLPRVGIIGAGTMGGAMARNLHGRGYVVTVRDVLSPVQDDAARAGLAQADSPAALAAQVDVVAVVVVNAAQIADVLWGTPDCPGLVAGARDGLVVLLCSTIDPQDAAECAARLAPYGVEVLDAPISGGPARALAGSMSMMLAGQSDVLTALEPLLADLAQSRFHLGPRVGDASRAKLVNNLLAGVNLVAAAEALALGTRLGLDAQVVFDLVNASSGQSWVFQDRMPRAIAGDFTPRAAATLLTKDLGLAVALAASVGAPTPLAEAALAQFRATVDHGWGALDDAVLLKTYLAPG